MMFNRIAAVVAASGALAGVIWTNRERIMPYKARASSFKLDIDNALEKTEKVKYKWNDNWDHRAASASNKKEGKEIGGEENAAKPTASRHLILIRHGQYEHWHEDSDKKVLTELGRRQAMATGERLKQLGDGYTIMYYSTMPRATETAQIISKSISSVPMKSCDLMREGAPFPPDPPSRHWKPDYHEFFCDGSRIEAAFRRYFHRASSSQKETSTEVLVCHANVIRYFVCRALQLPPEAWLRMSLANASITRVTIRPNGSVSLKSLGSYDHIAKDMVTFT